MPERSLTRVATASTITKSKSITTTTTTTNTRSRSITTTNTRSRTGSGSTQRRRQLPALRDRDRDGIGIGIGIGIGAGVAPPPRGRFPVASRPCPRAAPPFSPARRAPEPHSPLPIPSASTANSWQPAHGSAQGRTLRPPCMGVHCPSTCLSSPGKGLVRPGLARKGSKGARPGPREAAEGARGHLSITSSLPTPWPQRADGGRSATAGLAASRPCARTTGGS